MTIQAIETHYAGHRFRSRLEARWAVFMNHLNVPWEYEPQGYLVNGAPYLPDFLVWPNTDHAFWLEIKGVFPTIQRDRRYLCRRAQLHVARQHGKGVRQ